MLIFPKIAKNTGKKTARRIKHNKLPTLLLNHPPKTGPANSTCVSLGPGLITQKLGDFASKILNGKVEDATLTMLAWTVALSQVSCVLCVE